MTDFTYSIDSVDLAVPWMLTKGTLYRPPVEVRRAEVVVPGSHGVTPVGRPTFGPPTVTFSHFIKGTDPSDLETHVQALVGFLAVPGDRLINRVTGSYSGVAVGRLVSLSEPEYTPRIWTVAIVSQFQLPGVFFRSAAVDSAAMVFPGVPATPFTVDSLAGCTGPIDDSVVRVTGPATSVSVYDDETGTGVTWTGALTGSQYLFINCATWSARVSSTATDWDSGGAGASGGLDAPGVGMLSLSSTPNGVDPTDRRVMIRASGTGLSAASRVTVHARKAYL